MVGNPGHLLITFREFGLDALLRLLRWRRVPQNTIKADKSQFSLGRNRRHMSAYNQYQQAGNAV